MRLSLSNPFRLARLGLSSSALLLLLLFPRHNARASGNPLPLALSSEAAVLLLVPPTLLVGVNGYYTTKAYLGPTENTQQSGKNAIYWTSWQAAIIQPLAGLGFVGNSPGTHRDTAMAFWAIGTWPLSLSAHGLWFAQPDRPGLRAVGVGTVTAADLAMLVYDASQLAEGRRVDTFYAVTETGIGALQSGFGVLTALRAEGSDRTLAWSFSALPVALTLHGALSLALPEESGELERESAGAAMPQFSLAPMPSGFFLQASGDW